MSDIREKKTMIEHIIEMEWGMFTQIHHVDGRASCQDNHPVFHIMRFCQFAAWRMDVLESYAQDLEKAAQAGKNLLMLKYAYMMKDTDPDYYKVHLASRIPGPGGDKKALAGQIIQQMDVWYRQMAEQYPRFVHAGRPAADDRQNGLTSAATYLRGELLTYSEKTLALFLKMVEIYEKKGKNLVFEIYTNTAQAYGYKDLETAEMHINDLMEGKEWKTRSD